MRYVLLFMVFVCLLVEATIAAVAVVASAEVSLVLLPYAALITGAFFHDTTCLILTAKRDS